MKLATWFLSRGYRCLLRLYPASFRAEFASEMDGVFAQAMAAVAEQGWGALVRLFLRELWASPGSLGRERASSFQERRSKQKGAIMESRLSPRDLEARQQDAEALGAWPHAILAALALLVPGLALIGWPLPIPWHHYFVFGSYLFILLGLLAGWVRGFPRWSYAFMGHSLLFALWLSKVSTPGLKLLGYAFTPNEVWGWRAWLGLGVVAVLALLLTRSLRPLSRLVLGVLHDWTRLSLALYGCLPLFMRLLFDEVHWPHGALMVMTSLFLGAGAVAYMRSTSTRYRILSLLAGLTTAWLAGGAGLAAHWTVPRDPYWGPMATWSEATWPMAFAWAIIVAILLAPAVLSMLQRVVPPRRTA